MRKLLILLAFLPLINWGQPPITPEKYWSDSIRPSDSAMIAENNTVLGFIDNVDFDITLGYLPIRTGATITIGSITMPVCCVSDWKKNYNYDSLLYFQISEQTINADTSENLPLRITEIATYVSATDVNSYFNVNAIPSNAVWVPGDYATIDEAIQASGVGNDTIFVKESTQLQLRIIRANLSIHAVGDVYVVDNDYSLECRADNIKVSGFEGDVNFGINFISISGAENCHAYNNYLHGTSNVTLVIGTLSTHTLIENTYINGIGNSSIQSSDSATFTNCLIKNESTVPIAHFTDYSCNYNYCDVNGISNYDWFGNTHVKNSYNFIGCDIKMDSAAFYKCVADSCIYNFKGCDIIAEGDTFFNLDFDSEFTFINNNVTVNKEAKLLKMLDADNYIKFQNNNININTTSSSYTRMIDFAYDQNIDSITNNIITVLNTSSFHGQMFRIQSTDSVYFCNNILYNNIDDFDADCDFINVDPNVYNTIYKCVISENELYQWNGGAHGIRIGAEATSSGDNKVENILIEKNKLIGRYTLSGTLDGGNHAVFIGFQSNPIVRYNYVEGYPLAYVHKGDGINTTGGRFYYNIAKNFLQGQLFKGVDKSYAYNNTFNSDISLNSQRGILVFENNIHPDEQSDSCQLINNIISIQETDAVALYVADSSYLGLVSNYNILDADSACNYRGDNITFQDWQSLGYDLNSYDTDPNFKSSTELWPISPSNAIGKGLNLGSEYIQGLNISTSWTDNIVYKNQISSRIIIGAYIVLVPGIATYNNGFWIFGTGVVLLK